MNSSGVMGSPTRRHHIGAAGRNEITIVGFALPHGKVGGVDVRHAFDQRQFVRG